jgi:WD40-like Beta Propeller Repeat
MMRGRGVLGALGGVVCASGMIALLAWVANELPRPLGTAARTSERLWQVTAKRDRLPGLTGPERKAVTTLAPHLDGMIVWSSNRGGHHDLYLINLRTRSVRQLTRAPSVSFFSRFSPDGRQIVFVRSQREWVSARDPTAWDVYLIQVDGTSERRIAVGAYHPTWTADGKGIIFHRETRVFRYDLATRQETMILDVARAVPGIDNDAGDVELAPDGRRFGFVLRGTFSGAHGLTGAFSGAAVFDPRHAHVDPARTGTGVSNDLGPGRAQPPVDGDRWQRGDACHDRPGRRSGPSGLHGPSRQVQPRVFPETVERRALAHLGSSGGGTRAGPGRL